MSVDSYLRMWNKSLEASGAKPLPSEVVVVGEIDRVLGPMMSRAKIEIRFKPSQNIEIENRVPITEELKAIGYPGCVIVGLFDVLASTGACSVKGFRIVLENAHLDPIHSSKMSFREAARDAAKKLLDNISLTT